MSNSTQSYPADLGIIDFEDRWLQDLLWEKQDPVAFYQTDRYTKTDMMKHLEHLHKINHVWFWGSKELGLVLRVHSPNKYVLEPHLLGNVHHWRTIQPIALEFAFKGLGIEKINVYTPYTSIRAVLLRYGFKEEGCLPLTYLKPDGQLVDQFILGLSKQSYEALQTTQSSLAG